MPDSVRNPHWEQGDCRSHQSCNMLSAMDGIIDRLQEQLGGEATVIATGGLAKKIVPHCRREIILDDDLLLKGLAIIYKKNRK